MKLNKDNFELMMFDLLEGNLSEKDALEVMKQIEEDAFFFKEWNLFKSTVLIADKDVVFEGKQKLLKKEGGIIPMFKWATIAVAASLVIALVVIWPNGNPVEIIGDAPKAVVEDPSIPIEQVEVVKTDVLPSNEDQLNAAEEVLKLEIAPVNKRNQNAKKAIQQIAISEKEENSHEIITPEINPIPEVEIVHEIPVTPIDKIEIEEPKAIIADVSNPKDSAPEVIADEMLSPDNKRDKINFKTFVTSSSRKRIKEKATQLIAAVSNPKIRLKPNFDGRKPSLQIELETTGYQAIASLQPFNKKKN